MIRFSHIAMSLLKDYKELTRRHFSFEESEQKFKELGLNGRLPRLEANLYRLLVAVSQRMSKDYAKSTRNVRYSGGKHFLSHLKEVLEAHQISGKSVVHIQRVVSREVLQAVQLMSLPEEKLTEELYVALNEKAALVAKHGEKEHKNFFKRSLQVNLLRHPDFFAPLKESYHHYLNGVTKLIGSGSALISEFASSIVSDEELV
jgi:hypothetical protein